ncbi:hypothetical protein KY345_06495 [Candidatus Woesearchaeota archaeon]|nr:hypothetical protein [Candidatus Woesearchaeota archaeon]
MSLDQLPVVSEDALLAHIKRIENNESYSNFMSESYEHLRTKNPNLWKIIEGHALGSPEEEKIRRTAYTLLHVLNDQIYSENMERDLAK